MIFQARTPFNSKTLDSMFASDLIEVVCAAHLAALVQSPYEERGGLMLVGPPGSMKSTFLAELDRQYPDALSLTDLNAKTLAQLRDRIAANQIRTLVFPEYAKIYERKGDTASNLEGALRAIVAEGFTAAAFEEQQINRLRARALVIGALTPKTQETNFARWEETGYNRRFLWSLIRLKDPYILEQAVLEWQRVKFRIRHVPQPPPFGERIPNLTTREERGVLRMLVKYQPGGSSTQQLQLMVKILAVLKWWYGETGNTRNPLDVLEAFGETLGRQGAEIELGDIPRSTRSRARQRDLRAQRSTAAKVLARAAADAKRKPKRKRGRRG